MRAEHGYPRYYAVNDRPVALVPTPDGGLDALVPDHATGELVPDRSYLSKVADTGIGKDVDSLTEEEFGRAVEAWRADLVRRLLAPRFPQWAALPVTPVATGGTANVIYRLGDGLALRIPRTESAALQVAKEARWLPVLGPALPLRVPEPLATAAAGEGIDRPWSVQRWLPGASADTAPPDDPHDAARRLAAFVTALRAQDATEGPRPGTHNFSRGAPLRDRDEATRAALAECAGDCDVDRANEVWEDALAARPWEGEPVWVHGDLSPLNLLVDDGRLSAVIDFGGLGAGDPACDVMVAWTFLDGAARETFRAEAGVDDDTWRRGLGWALSVAAIALPYYRTTNPPMAAASGRTLAAAIGG